MALRMNLPAVAVRPNEEAARARSRLFHAIVVAGAALGNACGGRTGLETPAPLPDGSAERSAGSDAAQQPPDAFTREAQADVSLPVDAFTRDSSPDVVGPVDAFTDSSTAPDAPDATGSGVCALPHSDGKECIVPGFDSSVVHGCCVRGACFQCFV
jgi:hypothetical protein